MFICLVLLDYICEKRKIVKERGDKITLNIFNTLFLLLHMTSCLTKFAVGASMYMGRSNDTQWSMVFEIVNLIVLPVSFFTFHFADSTFLVRFGRCGCCLNIFYLLFVLTTYVLYDILEVVYYSVWYNWKLSKYAVFSLVDFLFLTSLIFFNCCEIRIQFNQKNLFTMLVAYIPLMTAFIPYFKVMVSDLYVNEFFVFTVAVIYFINNHQSTDYNICVSLMLVFFGVISIFNVALYFIVIQMGINYTVLNISQCVCILSYVLYYFYVWIMLCKNLRSNHEMFSGKVKFEEKNRRLMKFRKSMNSVTLKEVTIKPEMKVEETDFGITNDVLEQRSTNNNIDAFSGRPGSGTGSIQFDDEPTEAIVMMKKGESDDDEMDHEPGEIEKHFEPRHHDPLRSAGTTHHDIDDDDDELRKRKKKKKKKVKKGDVVWKKDKKLVDDDEEILVTESETVSLLGETRN